MNNKIIFHFLSFINKIVNIVICFIFSIFIFVSLYALYDYYQIYDSVKIENNDENYTNYVFEDNVIGWINIYDTSINYPIVKGKDNKEYLNKDYKNEYSKAGSIFLDYRNNNLSDSFSIIYGHNLSNGGMFSDIKKYKDKVFFYNHLNGSLYANNKRYEIIIILLSEINAYDEIYNLKNYKDNNYIINRLVNNSINKVDKINNYNNLLLLSTCSKKTNYRLVLLCYIK